MAFWRRIWQREGAEGLAACTALDVGTEFAKALVFEIDDEGLGTVRGVGRKRQGLSIRRKAQVYAFTCVRRKINVCTDHSAFPAAGRPSGRIPALIFRYARLLCCFDQ